MPTNDDVRPQKQRGLWQRIRCGIRSIFVKIATDLRDGRHREAYALFAVGLILSLLGFADTVDTRVLVSGCLVGIAFLLFNSTMSRPSKDSDLDSVLLTREALDPLSASLREAREIRVYGPTAVNVLVNIADIRRYILDRNGSVKVLIQDNESPSTRDTAAQLDDSLDFVQTLATSREALDRLGSASGFEYRLMPFNPGFSLFIVNPRESGAYLIFESHGFKDTNIADRMHIRIEKTRSPHWFEYWVGRFDAMWATARAPAVDETISS